MFCSKVPARSIPPSGYVEVKPGSFCFFDKRLKQEYFCGEHEFIHDYVRFEPDKEFAESFLYRLPMNRIFSPDCSEELENLFMLAAAEFFGKSKFRNEALNTLVKLLLIKATEYSCNLAAEACSKRHIDFLELRADIYSNPQDYASIDEIADKLHMSKSHFQALYKKYFQNSCINDVISARIEKAKLFLDNTDKSIYEIAFLCGYKNVEHFARQFKKLMGSSPSTYRNKCRIS